MALSRLSRGELVLRCAPLLLVPVLLALSTFPGRFQVPPAYWALSIASAVVFAVGARWPVPAALVLSALAVPLFAAEAWGLSGLAPYLGAVAVADVAARSDRTLLIAAVAVWWSAALVVGAYLDAHTVLWTATTAVTILAGVGLPVLLGLYLRGQRRLAESTEAAVRLEERSAMARELHDIVAHHMASIVLRAGVAGHVMDGVDARVAAVLSDVHDTALDALTDIRRLQAALRDPALSDVATIERDAVLTEIHAAIARVRAAGLEITAHVEPNIVGLDALARLTLLRVTQEALTNVMKHADRSAPAELTIITEAGGVAIHVSSSRTAGHRTATDGHGIIGMAERLDLVGGRFDVRQDEDRWVIDAWLPGSAGEDVR